jgi:hypothetical protein
MIGMEDKKQFKVHGIRFARSLQMLVKMVNMFSAEHKSAAGMLQRSYEFLNPLVKQARYLTLGFVDQRVLLNNILTAEDSLKPLENEFLKRGIGAITFEAGITLAAYRNAVATISTAQKTIEENGGLLPFLEQRDLQFVRIFPAPKSETRNEDGDTVLDMGSEEYLISKALSNMNSGSRGVESILAQMDLSAAGADGFAEDSGNGGTGSNGMAGLYSGGHGGNGSQGNGSYLMDVQRMVEQKFDASLKNPDEDPQQAYVELAKMLRNVRPDFIASNLMIGQALNPETTHEEVTTDVFEDTALRWALRRLVATPTGEEAVIVEEKVFRVLMRSLQATHSAGRLAQKLAEFAKEYALPKHTLDRIQDEIHWITLTPKQKLRDLLAMTHFTAAQFRRCLDLIKELIRQGNPEDAIALGTQYLTIFDDYLVLEITEVSRLPELLRSLAGTKAEFWDAAAECLTQAVASRKLNQLVHVQVVNALVTLARLAATYENFALVQKVGDALEESAARDSASHTVCCKAAIANLLQPSAVDRIAEIFLERKNEMDWIRTIACVLRWAGPGALERIFVALDKEPAATNRLALLRLLGRIGHAGLPAARQRLKHKDWYVVRNACKLLGDLKDPELFQHIAPAFESNDERVQKAALRAVMDSRLPGKAAAIANALPFLSRGLLEDALCELMYAADSESLPGLEKYCDSVTAGSNAMLITVIRVVTAVSHDSARELLVRIAASEKLDPNVRSAALQAASSRSVRQNDQPPQPQDSSVGTSEAVLQEQRPA